MSVCALASTVIAGVFMAATWDAGANIMFAYNYAWAAYSACMWIKLRGASK